MKKILLVSFVLIILVSLFLTFKNYNLGQIFGSKPAIIPKQASSSANIDSLERCDIKKQNNPLLEEEAQIVSTNEGDKLVGSFKGNIESISLEPDNLSALVELNSLTGNQKHIFNIIAQEGLAVFNQTTKKDLTIVDLAKGQTISLTFSCPVNQTDFFKITKITVY